MKPDENSNLEIKANIYNSSYISNNSRGSELKDMNQGIMRPEVLEKLVVCGLELDQIITAHKIYKFTEVEEACNLIMKDPETNLYHHEFIPLTTEELNSKSNLNYEKNKISSTISKSKSIKSKSNLESLSFDLHNCKICNGNYSDHSKKDLPCLRSYISLDKQYTKEKYIDEDMEKENEDEEPNSNQDDHLDNELIINKSNLIIKKFSLEKTDDQKRRKSLMPNTLFQINNYKNIVSLNEFNDLNDNDNNKKKTVTCRLNFEEKNNSITQTLESDSICNNSRSKILINKNECKPKFKSKEKDKKQCKNKNKTAKSKVTKTYKVPEETLKLFSHPDICPICYDDTINEKNIAKFSCGHFYCCACVTKYLTTNIVEGKV